MMLRPLLRRASTIVPALAWLALPVALCAQSGHAAPSDSAAVASVLRRFLTAFENLDAEPFRAAFADSATVFHPAANMPERVTGRVAIDSTFRAVFADVRAHATGGPPFQHLTPVNLPSTSRADGRVARRLTSVEPDTVAMVAARAAPHLIPRSSRRPQARLVNFVR